MVRLGERVKGKKKEGKARVEQGELMKNKGNSRRTKGREGEQTEKG